MGARSWVAMDLSIERCHPPLARGMIVFLPKQVKINSFADRIEARAARKDGACAALVIRISFQTYQNTQRGAHAVEYPENHARSRHFID